MRFGDQPRDKIKESVECLLFSTRQFDGFLMGKSGVGRDWRDRLRRAFALRLEFAHLRAMSMVAINAEISG